MPIISEIRKAKFHLVYCGKNILVKKDSSGIEELFPPFDLFTTFSSLTEDFLYETGYDYSCCSIKEEKAPSGYEFIPLREIFDKYPELISITSRAKGILHFKNTYRFCPTCGSPYTNDETETALYCSECNSKHFPRIEPCIIVLVHKGDDFLLVRHSYRIQDIYACIAGFMELGETAEECVKREVLEETGITVKNIQYKGSQSWPFPDQLMLAFTAEYESGTIRPQETEILEARWFTKEESKSVAQPAPGSVAYRLINNLF